jgi:acetolactate synthase I/II/III large subunit
MLRQAFATMRAGRPGPVHLDVPLNVFVEETDEPVPDPGAWHGGLSPGTAAREDDVERCLDLLLGAERPVIVAGNGVQLGDASDELAAFAAAVGVPVAQTPLGKGCFDRRSPLGVGETGRNGTYQANRTTREADVVLAVGTRFDDRSTSSWLPGYTYAIPPTRLIHVDLDPAEIGRNYPAEIAITANAKDVFAQLHRAAARRAQDGDPAARPDHAPRAAWRARIGEWARAWEAHVAPHRTSEARPIRPERVLSDLRAALPDDGILLADVGVHHN